MGKEMPKRRINAIKKLIIFIVLIIILSVAIWGVAARYTSSANSIPEIEIAMYVIDENYQSMSMNLGKMVPREEPYIHNFSISNYNDTTRADVDIEYTITISTTTNIPLVYELYLNQSYNDPDAKNIILTNTIETDEYGTYFRKITTNPRNFSYKENETDVYQLVIYFPSVYTNTEYQDMIEGLEIQVQSKQIIE